MQQATLIDVPVYDRSMKRIKVPRPAGVEPGKVIFRWPDSVRHVWKRPVQLTSSDWAGKYRINEDGGPRPGPWNNDVARYLCGPMDVFNLPFIREIVIVAPPQTGKTEIMLNQLASVIDQAPGPALMVYEQQEIAKRMCTTRVRSMIELSPRLRKYLTGKADDLANFLINLRGMRIPFAWATSVSQLSNQPIRYLFLDEVEKYESTNKAEAGPVALARKRTRAYSHTSKTVLASSPGIETGEITVAYKRVQARFEFAVQCPDCGQFHVMQFTGKNKSGVVWPEDERNPEKIQARKLAHYVCPDCGTVWDDYKRDIAVRRGHWREKETHLELMAYCKRYRPRSVGFQFSALISPFVSLSETAAKFVLAMQDLKVGMVDAYKDWLNGYMAEIWKEDFSPRKEDVVLALRDDRPSGLVPDPSKVAAIVATVDTQDDGFPYEIRAWGFGQETESWQIRSGFVETLDGLDKVLWIPYFDADGNQHFVQLAGIDSQGHRTREVYDWCITNRGRALPLRGEQRMKEPYALSKLEVWPGTTTKIPGGLQLLRVHTKHFKDALHRKLSIAPADPGAWHMNAECTEEWAKQMCAEYVDDKQVWVCPSGKANHAWDVSVYSFCLADYLGTRYMLPEVPEDDAETEQEQQPPARPRSRLW